MVALARALLFDYEASLIGPSGIELAKLLVALIAVTVVFVSPWLGAQALTVVAALVATASLAVSVALAFGAGHSHAPEAAYCFAEPAALLWLLLMVPLRGRSWWVSWAAAPLLWASIVLRPIASDATEISVIIALFFAVGSTAVLGAGATWRLVRVDRRRRAEALRLQQRTEFARDLHDFVAHHVTGIVVQAQGALAIAEKQPLLVRPSLEQIERAGAEALTSMRRMVGMLRDGNGGEEEPALAPLGDISEVRSLVEGFSAVGASVRARLDVEGAFDGLPVEVTTTAHRVVMEALTNVRRHAHGCTAVHVRLVRSVSGVTVEISDNGRSRGGHGFGSGFGLKGLAERVSLVDGSIEAGPTAGGGWSVRATLPVHVGGVG
ncbi:histidine kinase [Streptomyces sp. NPDC046821]|uniref:sensor histidine kinase n=1 Tax=Streptomyces sp. NPDC046821 TaxID=3154702 RepID=UPI0033D4EDC1